MRKYILPLAGGLLLCASLSFAGSLNNFGTDRVSDGDWGNSWKTRTVAVSTSAAVIISSTPTNAGIPQGTWRARTIVNISTAALALYPDNTNYSVYYSSYGVQLSSDNVTGGYPKQIEWHGDAAIYGSWSNGAGTPGAIVIERYQTGQ